MKYFFVITFLLLLSNSSYSKGIRLTHKKPKIRLGVLPIDFFFFKEMPNNMGKHSFKKKYNYFSKNKEQSRGMTYTCAYGFIDITHVRIATDWAAKFVAHFEDAYKKEMKQLVLETQADSYFTINLKYPKGWDSSSQSERLKVIKEYSLSAGLYLAHLRMTWHEIITWHGYSSMQRFSEKPSAFSYEDIISNILGVEIASRAIKNEELDYDSAVNLELEKMFDLKNGTAKRVDKKRISKILNKVNGLWIKRVKRKDYIHYRKENNLPKIKFPRVYGITNYIKRKTDLGLFGEPVWGKTVDDVKECNGYLAKSASVDSYFKARGIVSISLTSKDKRIASKIAKKPIELIVIKIPEDFPDIVFDIEKEMKLEFGPEIVF